MNETTISCIGNAYKQGHIETREPHHVVSRKGEFYVRIKPNYFPQFEGKHSVCLAELFAMPLATQPT